MPTDTSDDESLRDRRRRETLVAIRQRSTRLAEWADTDALDHPIWEDRAVAAAKFVPAGARVLDLGCGKMLVERHLPPDCTYVPLDAVSRDERTIVCDLNRDPFPPVTADMAIGLGVMEYLYQVPRFLRRVAKAAPLALLTYYPLEAEPRRDRLSMGWVNALNSNELIALMRHAGFKKVEVVRYSPKCHFFLARTI